MKKIIFTLIAIIFIYSATNAQDSVNVNSLVQYQTITGWGHGGGVLGGVGGPYSMLDSSIANPVNKEYLDYLVDDLGLTGSRTWEVGPRIDGTGMDNGDCDSINWTLFQSNSLPLGEANYLVYYQNKILAKGIQPNFYSSPGYPTHATDQKPWILNHPGERAQQIWASAKYMRDTYGININYDVIYNEPSGNETSTILADDVKALGPRLIAQGLSTKSQYAEAVAPQTDWGFITPVRNDTLLWSYVGRLSYHNYGTADPYRDSIFTFGQTVGLTTAQTEMGNPTFDDLYNDLTLAQTSYWEVGYSASTSLASDTGLTTFTPSSTFFRLHQVIHYVTPGSIRIAATANDAALHVLAFSKSGNITTIIENTSGTTQTVHLSGLPAGVYGLSRAASGSTFFQEMGLQTVTGNGLLDVTANSGSTVTTLYPYTGTNHAPDILTFVVHPGYLILPATTATLSATVNDAELDPLTYHWTVLSSPIGSNPVIANPTALSSVVSGLTVAGNYVFNIAVNDGINTSNKQVYLEVYDTLPKPVLGSAGFRIAAPYGLVFGNPGDTTHANIELPTSTVTLQCGIADLANTDFTGRGTWSIVSQPIGGVAVLGATTYIYVSIRANVTGMTVPGDYVFQLNVTDAPNPDLTCQIICTVHPQSNPPVINSITASPNVMDLPASSSLLTAVTSDPENDLLRHWWVITSAPAGSNPVFDHQGRRITNVSGLTVAGTYVFTLRCFDDLHMTTQNITVIVNPAVTGIQTAKEENGIVVYPNPATSELTIHSQLSILNSQLKITDVIGNEVYYQTINNSTQTTIDISKWSNGVYFYQIRNEKETLRGKFVVEK